MTELTPDLLLRAYMLGIFPMADARDAEDIYWVEPKRRGVIPLNAFHVPRSLAKLVRQDRFEIRVDTAFAAVIRACAGESEALGDRTESWINRKIEDGYIDLHERGTAHSVEAWRAGALVGGLYGVVMGAAFFGESMFSAVSGASKVALVHLVARLRIGGFRLLDAQFQTEHLAQFGTVEVSRQAYQKQLQSALGVEADFYRFDSLGLAAPSPGSLAMQLISDTP